MEDPQRPPGPSPSPGRLLTDQPEGPSACPPEDLLVELAEGTLGPEAATGLYAHFDGCAECRWVAARLIEGDGGQRSPRQEPLAAAEVVRGESLPEYRLLGVAGTGGMGTVFEAEDLRLERRVALKVMHDRTRGAARSEESVRRFLREARITAMLEHPSIVPVIELGRLEDGTPYYAQRLVRGRTLAEALAASPTLEARLALLPHFLDLCQAVAYAHGKGVIHRDLKPANVMVGAFGETLVLDWGLGRVTGEVEVDARAEPGLDCSPELTVEGTALGTPAYMSPEQAHGRLSEVDERSDVWSLGAMLYEFLAGKPPFSGRTSKELLEIATSTPVPALGGSAPQELAAIAKKALSRDRALRYPSAAELAQEVAAFSAGRRVGAYQYSSMELLGRVVARHKLLFAVSVVALFAAAWLPFGVSQWRAKAEQGHNWAERLLSSALGYGGYQQWDRSTTYFAITRTVEDRLDARLALVALGDWGITPVWRKLRHRGRAMGLAFSPDGKVFASAGDDGDLVLCDGQTGQELRRIPMGSAAHDVLFTDDALLVAVGSKVVVFEPSPGAARRTLEAGAGVLALARQGSLLAAGTERGLRLWNLETGAALPAPQDVGRVESLAFARGLLLWPDRQHGLRRLDPVTGLERDPLVAPGLEMATFSAAAGVAVVVYANGEGGLWDLDAGRERFHILSQAPERRLTLSAVAPDANWFLLQESIGQTRVYSALSGESVATTAALNRPVTRLIWSPSSDWLARSSDDGAVSVWNTAPARGALGHRASPTGRPTGLAFSPDGGLLVSADDQGRLRLWSGVDGEPLGVVGQGAGPTRIAFAPQGELLASAGADGVRLWSVTGSAAGSAAGGHLLRTLSGRPSVALAWDPLQRWLAVSQEDGAVHFFAEDGREALPPTAARPDVPFAIAVSPDGQTLATGGDDRDIAVWDLVSRGAPRSLTAHSEKVTALAFVGPGRLVSGSNDRSVRLWDVASGAEVHKTTGGSEGEVRALQVTSPAGGRFPSAALVGMTRGMLELWDTASGKILTRVGLGAFTAVDAVAILPDASRAAWMQQDGGLHLFSPPDESKLGPPQRELDRLLGLYGYQWERGDFMRESPQR